MSGLRIRNKYRVNWILYILVIMACALIAIWVQRKSILLKTNEGFKQDTPFSAKYDNDVYDDFYVDIYDRLHFPKQQIDIIINIVNMTMPTDQSTFLDIGSGTGALTDAMVEYGYNIYGIDSSISMVDKSKELFPRLISRIKCGDSSDPMSYDKQTFSHILATNFTIYHFEDKTHFFRNCYSWLKPNGYLIIHLADRAEFSAIIPAGRSSLISNPQDYADRRLTDTKISFPKFEYHASYDFSDVDKDKVVCRETFKDGISACIRQNEKTLYMNTETDIFTIAQHCGFIVKGKMTFAETQIKDEHQCMIIFEKVGTYGMYGV
jgi:SAM-dependent methyltransferase